MLSKLFNPIFLVFLSLSNISCKSPENADCARNSVIRVQKVDSFTTLIDSTYVPVSIGTSSFVHLEIRDDWELFGVKSYIFCEFPFTPFVVSDSFTNSLSLSHSFITSMSRYFLPVNHFS